MNNTTASQTLNAFGLSLSNDVPIIRDAQTGQFVAFKFDLLKPGRNYYDLSAYTNAMQGENGFRTPVYLTMNGVPLVEDENTDITIKGNDPRVKNSEFSVIPSVVTSGTGLYNIDWPAHTFQVAGTYVFHIEVSKGGNVYKTAQCLLDVEPDMVTVATDFKNGVSPYDSEFEAMRAKIQAQLQDIETQTETNAQLQQATSDLTKQIASNADNIVNGALNDVPKLDGNNSFTGINTFGNMNAQALTTQTATVNGALSADNMSANSMNLKKLLLNGQDITNGLVEQAVCYNGTPINGITWFYANVFKLSFAKGILGIMDMEFNVPNNSTFQNASESNPVSVFQYPKGSLSGLGGTPFSVSGALLRLNTSSDTLDFVGTTTSWESWGKAVRGYVPTFAMHG